MGLQGIVLFLAMAVSIALVGCKDEEVWRGSGSASFLEFDSELTPVEAAQVNGAMEYLSTRSVQGENVRWFREIFGGVDTAALRGFLELRLHYVLSGNTEIESRVRINAEPVVFQPRESSLLSQEDDSGRGATNLASLWFLKKAVEPEKLQFVINDELIPVESTRIGIIQLGPAFLRAPPPIQVGVLLHEGRHSDCTQGIWRSDILRTQQGVDPVGVSCGHLHVLCPTGHEYEGLFACDEEAWGAYSVNFIYWAAVARTCKDCPEEERVLTEAAALDAATRILIDVTAMVRGDFGAPDMSSSTEVQPR
jgi:hypothetical protein